jgi:hypothetical protein
VQRNKVRTFSMARIEDRRWKTLFKQNDAILAKLSQLHEFKDSYEQKLQAVQYGFESRLDKLENEVAAAISNTTTIISALEKIDLSKKKTKPALTKIKRQRAECQSDEFELSPACEIKTSDAGESNSVKISAPKATAELVILAPTYNNHDSSDDDEEEVRSKTKIGTRRSSRKKRNKFFDLHTFQYFFGISKPDLRANLPGSRAIHPDSPFMAGILPLRLP